jgi:hypothetical protein
MVAALLVGINAGFLTAQRIHGSPEAERSSLDAAIKAAQGGRDLRDLGADEMEALDRKISPIVRQILRDRLARLGIPVFFGLFLLATTAVIYAGHPRRFRRRHQARPLNEEDAPTVVRYVKQCAASLGLPPLKLLYRSGYGNEAQTFGLSGREELLFYGSPALLEGAWNNTSRAVILHELGHVKNHDAQAPQQTWALGIALIALLILSGCLWITSFLPDLLRSYRTGGATATLSLLAETGRSLPQLGWRIGALLLLAWLIWKGLLRTRELYADRRVASWGSESTLDLMLRLPEPGAPGWERSRWWEAAWSRWGEREGWRRFSEALDWLAQRTGPVFKPHPTNRSRWEALRDPVRLFRVSPILAFVTGALLSILTVSLILPVLEIVSDFHLVASMRLWHDRSSFFLKLPAPWDTQLFLLTLGLLNLVKVFLPFSLALVAVSYLLTGTLGVQIQREAIADLATGHPKTWGYGRLWRSAVLLALGLETGFFAAPFNIGLTFPSRAGLLLLWLAGLSCFTWLWLVYVRALTRFTMGVHAGTRLPRKLRALVTVSAVALLTVLYWPVGFARLAYRISLLISPAGPMETAVQSQERFVYLFVMTGAVLTMLTVVLYVAGTGVSLAAVAIRLWRRRPQCPSCQEPVGLRFCSGRPCEFCGLPLALWAYAAAPFDPASLQKGEPTS